MQKKHSKIRTMEFSGKMIVWIYAIILTVPLFFILVTAFKTEEERVINPIGLPEQTTLESFMRAWTEGNLLQASVNSIVISVAATFLVICNIVLISFCLNRIRDTKIGNIIYMYILASMFIPGVGTVTTLVMRRNLGLYNNLFGEIFCGALGIATGVFLVSGFLRTIPKDLEEAAMLDGANDFQICTKVIVPVITPALVTIMIQSFTAQWNNVLGAMLTLRDEKLYTIPMALMINFSNEVSTEYATTFAGVVLTCIPIIMVYWKCQKHFLSAMAGSVKG